MASKAFDESWRDLLNAIESKGNQLKLASCAFALLKSSITLGPSGGSRANQLPATFLNIGSIVVRMSCQQPE